MFDRYVRNAVLAALCASALGATARAQDALTPAPPLAPEAAPAVEPAAIPAADEEPVALEAARGHFKQGIAYAEAGNCGAAIAEFEAAYKLVPRANALYNIGQCEERLFRYDLAIATYQRYLQEAPPDAPDRPSVQAALGTLRNLLGVVHLTTNVPAEVWIDDRLAGVAPGDVYVPAGGHSLEVRAEGFIPKRAEVKLVGRQEMSLSLTLDRAQTTVQVTETTGLSPVVFWVGTAATVVALGVGVGFALDAGSQHDHAETLPAVDPAREQARADIESAELTADIFFGGALVLGIGTTIVGFLTDWDGDERRPDATEPPSPVALRVTPIASQRVAGVSLQGAF
jgi:tetratricopeptide (TPR) repeat protein